MTESITRALTACIHELSAEDASGQAAEDIADVLWLVRALQADLVAVVAQDRADEGAGPAPLAPDRRSPGGPGSSQDSRIELTHPADQSARPSRPVPATVVGLRSPAPPSSPLSATRVLQSFKRVDRPGAPVIDIEATVEATADAGRLVIVTRPRRERGLDAVIVADASPAMAICGDEVAELTALLRRTGAFRSVTRWSLVPRSGPGASQARTHGTDMRIRAHSKVDHPADRLLVPSGRRLVLFVTDGLADHCYSAELWRALERWAQVMPTAVIHILPDQYRPQSALGGSAIFMRSRWPAAPNSTAETEATWWDERESPKGRGLRSVPVPVVALRPDDMTAWAKAVTSGTSWVAGVWAEPPPRYPEQRSGVLISPIDRVRAFQARATRQAQLLARVLAGAPVISWPLIRALQARLTPGTGASVLAEVAAGGLLERIPDREGQDGDERFRFRADVSGLLAHGTTVAQEWDVFEAVSDYLEQHSGTGSGAKALLADPGGGAKREADLSPFAALGRAVAARLGIDLRSRAGLGDDVARWDEREHPDARPSDTRPGSPIADVGGQTARQPIDLLPAAAAVQVDDYQVLDEAQVDGRVAAADDSRTGRSLHSIVMMGPPSSGKTTLLAAFNVALARQQPENWHVAGADRLSTDALVKLTTDLVDHRTFPAATALAIEHHHWLLMGQIWLSTRRRWTSLRRTLEQVTIGLDLVDASGELGLNDREPGHELVGPRRPEHGPKDDLIDSLADSQGILFVFDPVMEYQEGHAFYYTFRLLAEMAERMVQTAQLADGRLPHYVAVCVTKFDEPRVLRTAEKLRLVAIDPQDEFGFPRVHDDDAREFLAELCNLSSSSNADLVFRMLESSFRRDRIKYFVTSSIGFHLNPRTNRYDPADPENQVRHFDSPDQRARIRGPIHPINVVEPLIWLSTKLAALPDS